MEPITSSNLYSFTVRLYTTGSGAIFGLLGIVLGTGDTGRVGGTHTTAGLVTGTGVAATRGIITTTVVRSGMHARRVEDMRTCVMVYRAENTLQRIPIVRSRAAMQV